MPIVGVGLDSVDGVNSVLDRTFGTSDDPTPSPSASPGASPSPSPSASPGDDMTAAIQQISTYEHGTQVATTGTYYALCLLVTLAICALLFSVLRRR